MMSLLLQDSYIHEIIFQLTDFKFIIADLHEIVNYNQLYVEEQNLVMYVLRIFAEIAMTARLAALNVTNGIIPICVRIASDHQKFNKEVRMWAFIIINRGCSHQQ
mmetsp:Transcript_35877/g.34933  ORF Transcript_35877/g.34933 Transcript_35877/m.34933 type:complete len:105 (+) Transcript_35877:342-656(+)